LKVEGDSQVLVNLLNRRKESHALGSQGKNKRNARIFNSITSTYVESTRSEPFFLANLGISHKLVDWTANENLEEGSSNITIANPPSISPKRHAKVYP
jgi:hypothetical protein